MASMEHPIFSISTKPDRTIRRYDNGKTFVEVVPSVKGLATVHDRDVLIFCISQIMAALNEEKQVNQTIRFKAFDLLKATNRGTDGRGYEQLRSALERLQGTNISTNITTGDEEILDGFGLIDRYRIVRETREGRMQEVEIKLSDWVFNAIQHREVLTLHRDYFRLRKPLERRIYEIARKHCGSQAEWKIGLPKLQEKCGSNSTEKEFRRLLKTIITESQKHHHIPDYDMNFDSETDMIVFTNCRTDRRRNGASTARLTLSPDAYEKARQAAPSWDVYRLEEEWRLWMSKSEKPVRNPDRAFVGFCRKWFEREGRA